MKTLWVQDQYLQQILAGLKTVEVRVAYPNIARLKAGDHLLLNGRYRYRICRVAVYADFGALVAPSLPPQQLLAALREIYPPEREALGAVALAIEPAPEETRA
jgi:ASC-1-like (ASCH) protein